VNKKEYKDGCEGCDISRTSILLPVGIIELPGDWILNHYDGKEGFLGWMSLQPRYHRSELTDLTKDEIDLLGKNIQDVDRALHQYWSVKFPDDPIERIYVASISESTELHLDFHLIPRTRKLGLGNPAECASWRIFELTDTWSGFPERYRIRDKEKRWSHVNPGNVGALMTHFRGYFWEQSSR
jgi:diadenosine tetraphosphate (Ap4A) HIT family hydrolase